VTAAGLRRSSRTSGCLRWAGTGFAGGQISFDVEVVHVGAEAAQTAGDEQGQVRLDGGQLAPMRVRVTHICRREPRGWRIVHRHGGWAPQNQSPASQLVPAARCRDGRRKAGGHRAERGRERPRCGVHTSPSSGSACAR